MNLLNKLTYKQKLNYLGIVSFLFFLVVYSMAIKKTIALKKSCNLIENQLTELKDAPYQINQIEKKLNEIKSIIGVFSVEESDGQSQLLEKCTEYCSKNNLVIRDFPKTHEYIQTEYLIQTNIVKIEGNFCLLLKFIYLLEQKYQIGKIISISFSKELDRKLKKEKLFTTLYIQNIKLTKNENK